MVDVRTYHQFKQSAEPGVSDISDLYKSDSPFDVGTVKRSDMDIIDFNCDEFPTVPELFVFPPLIVAFDLVRKEWSKSSRVVSGFLLVLTTFSLEKRISRLIVFETYHGTRERLKA